MPGKDCAGKQIEFDQTVSSRDLNMKLCLLHESGFVQSSNVNFA